MWFHEEELVSGEVQQTTTYQNSLGPGWLLLFLEFSSSQHVCYFFRFSSSRDGCGIHPSALTQEMPSVAGVVLKGKYLICSSWDINWPDWGFCLSALSSVAIKRNGLLFSFDGFCCCQGGDSPDLANNKTLESDSVKWVHKLLQELAVFKEVICGWSDYNVCEDAFSHTQGLKSTHSRVFQDFTSLLPWSSKIEVRWKTKLFF